MCGQIRMVGRDRHQVREGEDARLRLGYRPGRAVGVHDLVAHRLHGRDLNEPARDHLRAETAEPVAEAKPLVGGWPAAADAGVHDHELSDPVRTLDGEPEADRPAPVLDDDGRVAEVELIGQPRNRAVVEVVGVVLRPQRLVGAAEPEVVGRDRPCRRGQLGDDLAVEVRPRRLAVQEQDGGAVALVEVVHAQAVLVEVVRREAVPGQILELLVRRSVRVCAHRCRVYEA